MIRRSWGRIRCWRGRGCSRRRCGRASPRRGRRRG
uniref:Uncharacterized protein n=1 Tax=Arundo donax TaxID=35708 RepID=A0A0A9CJ64_ARUDO